MPEQPHPIETLERICDRVLWLAMSIVHFANHERTTRSGLKVGGHQSSSASMVSIMTALYFGSLRAEDRVSVKPHASPVLHAIEFLLGRIQKDDLETLRAFGGLQSYPSRSKDPTPADFSTGSVGIGATATIWSAIAHRYVTHHFDVPPAGRMISLVGDAELDEGAVWEAIVDPMVEQLGEVLWLVDVNRQSLDRIVPTQSSRRVKAMFEAAGWRTITLRYGQRLMALFAEEGGMELQARLETLTNSEYQRLLRMPAGEQRTFIAGGSAARTVDRLLDQLDDSELGRALRNLGGHDLAGLIEAIDAADRSEQPTIIFADTIKGWRLPIEGHPGNHSALLTPDQWRALATDLEADATEPWAGFDAESPEGRLCQVISERLERGAVVASAPPPIPSELPGRSHRGKLSTQQVLGRTLLELAQSEAAVTSHLVTVSPDVASSTSLGSWMNRAGVWNPRRATDGFADDPESLIRWRESPAGQHIELGIAETNLVSLLAELGSTWSRDGQPLLPIGTLYDPFVGRALEPWSFGIYSGGQAILVGTPSGVTLAPEGGAHQSIITPSIGLEQPGCIAWEPAFAQDFEWCFLYALSLLGQPDGSSSYFRLTTRALAQDIAAVPEDPVRRDARRRDAIAGGYRLRTSERPPVVTLVGVGAVMPEVCDAAEALERGGFPTDVVCLSSPDRIFRAWRSRQALGAQVDESILDRLFPRERAAPTVTVLDGHPHTLSFIGAIQTSAIACLGVDWFGQSGDVDDLYRYFGIDPETIVGAALDLIDP